MKKTAFGNAKSQIFPYPREIKPLSGSFQINEQTVILVPENPSESDLFLALFFLIDPFLDLVYFIIAGKMSCLGEGDPCD